MKDKEKLSMYVDITRITITLCWVALIAFWCLKLFGGNWFEIMVENEKFIKFSELVQNSWIYYLFNLITTFIANFFIYCSISESFYLKGYKLLFYILSSISMWAIVHFTHIDFLIMFYGYVLIILYSVLVQKSWKKLYGVLAILFEFVFTTITLVTRNLELKIISNYFIMTILSIDMYIMYALYYLYSNLLRIKKENGMAFLVGHGWLSKESAQINGYNAWKRFWHNVGYALSFKWAKKK